MLNKPFLMVLMAGFGNQMYKNQMRVGFRVSVPPPLISFRLNKTGMPLHRMDYPTLPQASVLQGCGIPLLQIAKGFCPILPAPSAPLWVWMPPEYFNTLRE
jgi:hypothetical protein